MVSLDKALGGGWRGRFAAITRIVIDASLTIFSEG